MEVAAWVSGISVAVQEVSVTTGVTTCVLAVKGMVRSWRCGDGGGDVRIGDGCGCVTMQSRHGDE